mmetsp:Transcript_16471/g.24728  ORF Transcript_16471/g.24728 Transcript_16471/m.24728 type:complete len:288 (-) Transcript_16471:10687-11550(-)
MIIFIFLLSSTANALSVSTQPKFQAALLFDCDGVIVETEELHRIAYNKAFAEFGLEIQGRAVDWSTGYYDRLQNTVGGGKPKMWYHFKTEIGEWPSSRWPGKDKVTPPPVSSEEKNALIDALQDYKTEQYQIIATSAQPRPGILRLIDQAIQAQDLAVGICSAATRAGFETVVDAVVGKSRLNKLDVIIAGDDVTAKKPDPMIYNLAADRLGLSHDKCLIVEDSIVGLTAANQANMRCIITYTSSTEDQDFLGQGAVAALPDLSNVSLDSLFNRNPWSPKSNYGHLK